MSIVTTTAGRQRFLYASPTESSRRREVAPPAAPDSQQSSAPLHAVESASTGRGETASVATSIDNNDPKPHSGSLIRTLNTSRQGGKSAATVSSAASPLRRDLLTGRALGLGSAISLKRTTDANSSIKLRQSANPTGTQPHPQTASAVMPSAVPHDRGEHGPPTYVWITSAGNVASGQFSTDPIEKCVWLHSGSSAASPPQLDSANSDSETTSPPSMGSKSFYCDEAFMTNTERERLGSQLADEVSRKVTFFGKHAVVFAVGSASTGKSQTLFHPQSGAVAHYLKTLMHELERTHMSQLWMIQVAVVNVVDSDVFDALPERFASRRAVATPPSVSAAHVVDSEAQHAMTAGDTASVMSSGSKQMSGLTSHHRTHSHINAESVFDSFALTIHRREDVEALCSDILTRNGQRSNISWQEIVHVRVAPATEVRATFAGLIRSVGTACFVEVGAGQSNDNELRINPKAACIQRHGLATVSNCLNALTRQSVSGSKSFSVHIPYNDTTLTSLLEPWMQNGSTFLVAHVSECFEDRKSSLPTLEIVDRLLRHRFPSGRAAVNYQAVARAQLARTQALEKELREARAKWESEKQEMETDAIMLKKAYAELLRDSSAVKKKEASQDATSEATVSRMSQLEKDNLSLTQALQSAKAMLSTTQREKFQLEALHASMVTRVGQLTEEVARREASMATQQTSPQRQSPRASSSVVDRTVLDSYRSYLHELRSAIQRLEDAGVVKLPAERFPVISMLRRHVTEARGDHWGGPGGDADDVSAVMSDVVRLTSAIMQLTHQLCERERALGFVLRHENGTDVGNQVLSLVKDRPSVMLSWRVWQDLLAQLHHAADAMVLHATKGCTSASAVDADAPAPAIHSIHVNGLLPKDRNMSGGVSMYTLAATASPTNFLKFWGSVPQASQLTRTSAPLPLPNFVSVDDRPAETNVRLILQQSSPQTPPTASPLMWPDGMRTASLRSLVAPSRDPFAKDDISAIERLARQLADSNAHNLETPLALDSPSQMPRLMVTSPSVLSEVPARLHLHRREEEEEARSDEENGSLARPSFDEDVVLFTQTLDDADGDEANTSESSRSLLRGHEN